MSAIGQSFATALGAAPGLLSSMAQCVVCGASLDGRGSCSNSCCNFCHAHCCDTMHGHIIDVEKARVLYHEAEAMAT